MDVLVHILKKMNFFDVVLDVALFAAPLWIAVSVGLLVGWVWKPKWILDFAAERIGNFDGNGFWKLDFNSLTGRGNGRELKEVEMSSEMKENEGTAVNADDLKHLYKLVEVTDGGPIWHRMMDKTMPGFGYTAWKREPKNGPPEYRSSTIFDDATPEVVKDFFWDDEFRTKNRWDDMLLDHTILETCEKTGTMVVRWVRKFPFFCSNREYILGRRIWSADGTYYCITKAVPHPSIPRHKKLRRVDLYYSSFCIRAVESRKGDGRRTACEVIFFHQEDMGIPREIAKLGVKQAMWGCIKKIEPGLRAYQLVRSETEPFSEYSAMAQIITKVSSTYLTSLEQNIGKDDSSIENENETVHVNDISNESVQVNNSKPWAMFIIGGAIVATCMLDQGMLTKAVLIGVARKFRIFGK